MRWRERDITTLLVDLDGTLLAARQAPLRLELAARAMFRLRERGWRRALRALRAIRPALEAPSPSERGMLNAERAALAFGRELGLGPAQAGELLAREMGAVFPRLRRHFYPVRGAREFLDWASRRYRLILATNPVWPIEQVELRLRWAGVEPAMFAAITHSGRMHHCKPSVEYYRELLEQEGLDPAECALVGDSLCKDLPATRAGISVFILGSERTEISPVPYPDARARAAAGTYPTLMRLLDRHCAGRVGA